MEKKGSKIIQLMKVSTKMTAIYGSKRPESNEWDFNGDVIQCLALCEDEMLFRWLFVVLAA